jgi:diguanylate cyclase (GGDEF)-like protein/PAS domain S-box-containing protein
MKRLSVHLGEHADLYRVGAAAGAACILVVLFVLTQPIELRRNNILLSRFGALQSDEARLGEAVLQLNFSLANNYDQVNSIIGHMRDSVREMQSAEFAEDVRRDTEFQRQLMELEQRLLAQSEALERFKSANAVLRNSLIYLIHVRNDLERELLPGMPAHEHVDDLVEMVILNRVTGVLLDRGDLDAAVGRVLAETTSLSAISQNRLARLVRHVRIVDSLDREMPGLLAQLTSHAETVGVAEAYRHYYDQRQRRAAAFRIFLLLLTLLLLSYAVRAFIRLREQSGNLRLAVRVFSTASEGFVITDVNGIILDVNAAFTAVTGYTREEVLGKSPRMLRSGRHDASFYKEMWRSIKESGQWQGEIWNRRKNGEIYPEWLTITAGAESDGEDVQVTHYVASFSDITQRKRNEAEIFQLAFYDSLTDLPNRRLLMDRLRHVLASRGNGSGRTALLFIDLDQFKTLNDIKGHDVGDLLLIEIAQRLRSCVREGDTVARLGGDEFVVMLENLSAESEIAANQAKAAAEKIHQFLNQPYRLKDFEYHSSCSIGISMFNRDISAEELLKHADTAMYEAKAAGRNALRFFDPAMQAALEARAALEADLRQALAQQQFVLYYQLQVNAERMPIGAEALLRWNHPRQGLLLPAAFIPLAEETGLIQPIGEWVLGTACAQLKSWQADPSTRDLTLAVNVSARQFGGQNFVGHIESLLLGNGVAGTHLKLEITESILLGDVERVIAAMRQLRALGVSFSMDDFGTGYSSLQYLKRLPLDQLKIDRSFVRDLTLDGSDQAIVRTIVAMAKSMNLGVIAEGVETEQQRQLLANSGCTNYQGFLFGEPMAIERFESALG